MIAWLGRARFPWLGVGADVDEGQRYVGAISGLR
jgi:hypothetical protein